MKNTIKKKLIRYTLLILAGIFIGWLIFHSPDKHEETHVHDAVSENVTSGEGVSDIWTCSMHPQIRQTGPGKCPLCGMDLIPLHRGGSVDTDAIQLSEEAIQLANVQTFVVSRQSAVKEVRLSGKVQADERLLQSQVAHIPGRIEKLMVNFSGENVTRGQTLALIYSPEMISAQQELIEAAGIKQSQPEIYEAAKEKLRQWKLTDNQIEAIEKSKNIQSNIEIGSNTNGIVTAIRVKNGDYISVGSILFEVADLSKVWVLFDAYESDLAFINKGDKIEFTLQAIPGRTFSGNIAFIDPVIDPVTRVAKVRVEVENQAGRLKPEMFAIGMVSSKLAEYNNKIVIPKSAVLWTGKRSIVYVKQSGAQEPVFNMREIGLGPMLGESFVVMDGIMEGEEIVSRGAFSIDAAAQLEGKTSMMSISGTSDIPAKQGIVKAEFRVSGLCEMCTDRIETAAKSVRGVSEAVWNIKTKMIKVEFKESETNSDSIQKVIARAGHDTEKYKADDKVYEALPECCLYRK